MCLINGRQKSWFKGLALLFAQLLLVQGSVVADPYPSIAAPQVQEGRGKNMVIEFAVSRHTAEEAAQRSAITHDLRQKLAEQRLSLSTEDTEQIWSQLERETLGNDSPKTTFLLDLPTALLITAREAYYRFQFERCGNEVDQAQSKVRVLNKDYPVSVPLIFHLALLKGVCLYAADQKQKAQEALIEALRFRPDAELDATQFSPQVVEAFAEAKTILERRQKNAATSNIAVQSEPPFVSVYLNGRFAGETPLTLEHQLQGIYYLKLSGKGFEDWFSRYEVSSPELLRIKAKMKAQNPNPVAVALPAKRALYYSEELPFSQSWSRELAQAARVLPIAQLTLVGLRPSERGSILVVLLFDVSGGRILRSSEQELPGTPTLDTATMDVLLSNLGFLASPQLVQEKSKGALQGSPAAKAPPTWRTSSVHIRGKSLLQDEESLFLGGVGKDAPPSEAEPPKKAVYRRWWFWSLLAVVAAGVVSGTAIALSSDNGSSANASGPALNPQGVVVHK